MKLKRKSKVGMWIAEKRNERVSAENWLKTEEGREWLKEWHAGRDERQAEVRRMLSGEAGEIVDINYVLKKLYPDDALPGPMPRMLW